MRISFVISSLACGGAERVLTDIANFLCKRGNEITIVTYIDSEADFYYLDPNIQRVRLDFSSQANNTLGNIAKLYYRSKKLRKAIKDSYPDRVISFMLTANVLTLLSCYGTGIPVIISERANPILSSSNQLWSMLRKLTYNKAKFLVIQTTNLKEWAERLTKPQNIVVIPNAVDDSRIAKSSDLTEFPVKRSWKRTIITMGRLVDGKGHSLLINSLKPLLDKYPDWGLEIIGDGPLRSELINLVQELDLIGKVKLHGRLEEPFDLIRTADIFVFPSLSEGFPNALLEAMSLGLPCISFNCDFGPSELIKHGHNGLLVETGNALELASTIERCMQDESIRSCLGVEAKKITSSYSHISIMKKWEGIITS